MHRALTTIAAGVASFLLVTGADAQTSVTTTALNLRTGPATAYPVIATVPPRQAVTVFGCTAGPGWCDIGWAGYRGWLAAAYLGPVAAYPVVVYDPVVYHNAYYAGQPYYGVGPGLPPRMAARRDARIDYRVHRRMDRRWDRWTGD